ncbi:MAG: branched-chain amino acid ABC transporter permease [Candidatus Velthaea sp.]
MTLLAQFVLSGLAQGAIFALAALGIVIIYNATRIVNFAHGAMGTAAAYAAWVATDRLHLAPPLAFVVALAVAFVLGVGVESLLVRRIRSSAPLTQMVLTIGLLMLLVGALGLAFGFNPKSLGELAPLGTLKAGGLIVRPQDALDLVFLGALVAAFVFVYQRTNVGLGMRAIAADPFAARLMGVPLDRILAIAWGLGVALAGATAVLAAPSATLTPAMMDTIVVYGFVAAIIGGFGTVSGAVAGGLLVGVADELIKAYIAPELSLSIVFATLVLALWLRPNGLFGRDGAQRV